MTITQDDITSFGKFAAARIGDGRSDLTFEDLLREWRERREYNETVESIKRSVAEYEAGQTDSLDQALANARQKIGLNE